MLKKLFQNLLIDRLWIFFIFKAFNISKSDCNYMYIK